MPSGGSETPGSDGHSDGLGVGTGSFGVGGAVGIQGTDGRTGGEMEGHGSGAGVGVGRAGGEGVGRHFGSGRLGRVGSVGAAPLLDAAEPVPLWHCGLGVAFTWSQAGFTT
jgi:hypothetical protein